MMNVTLYLEGEVSIVSLSNVGEVDELDINIDDLNEESDIKDVMEQLDALYESSELDITTDIKKFTVMNPEDISYMGIKYEDEEEQDVSLDAFNLKNESFSPVKELLENANIGDLIYLRKTVGKSNWEFNIQVKDKDEMLNFSYFDCSCIFDQYDLLLENYYSILCDAILPESLSTGESKAVVENHDIEPQIVYVELYKVAKNIQSGEKILERVDIPGYYFLEKTRSIDE